MTYQRLGTRYMHGRIAPTAAGAALRCSLQRANHSLSEYRDSANNTSVCLLLQHQASSFASYMISGHPRILFTHMQHQHLQIRFWVKDLNLRGGETKTTPPYLK
ncbi:hypothetical protein QL285_003569 [Trifolium repens]|nr:hypothetical protein QL285_003569 [Trifolium repens]